MSEICDKIILKEKQQIKNLFKTKEFHEIVLGKGLFVSINGQLCLTKRHLVNQEGKVEVKYLPHRKLYLTLSIHIKKNFFFQKGQFLTKRAIQGHFIFLK